MQEFDQAGGDTDQPPFEAKTPGDHSCNFSMAGEGGGVVRSKSHFSQNLLLHQYDCAMFPKKYLTRLGTQINLELN